MRHSPIFPRRPSAASSHPAPDAVARCCTGGCTPRHRPSIPGRSRSPVDKHPHASATRTAPRQCCLASGFAVHAHPRAANSHPLDPFRGSELSALVGVHDLRTAHCGGHRRLEGCPAVLRIQRVRQTPAERLPRIPCRTTVRHMKPPRIGRDVMSAHQTGLRRTISMSRSRYSSRWPPNIGRAQLPTRTHRLQPHNIPQPLQSLAPDAVPSAAASLQNGAPTLSDPPDLPRPSISPAPNPLPAAPAANGTPAPDLSPAIRITDGRSGAPAPVHPWRQPYAPDIPRTQPVSRPPDPAFARRLLGRRSTGAFCHWLHL